MIKEAVWAGIIWLTQPLKELLDTESDECPLCKKYGYCFGTHCNGSGKLPTKSKSEG